MSVSAFNQSVAPSPESAALAGAKSNTERSRTSSTAQPTVGVSFSSPLGHCGPVFGGPPSRPLPITVRPNPGSPPRPLPIGVSPNPGPPPRPLPITVCPNPGPPPRPLPIGVRPNPGPPPRPNPTVPDPYYSKQSNEQLAQALLDNYAAFKGRWPSRSVTRQSLQKMADQPLTGNPEKDAMIRLAKEVLRRPALVQAFDRNGDGLFSKKEIRSVVRSDNPLKLYDDKQLVQEMLNHFDALKGSYFNRTIKLSDLSTRASQPLTGNLFNDHLIQLSRAVLARPDLKEIMDHKFSWLRDGKVSRQGLLALLV